MHDRVVIRNDDDIDGDEPKMVSSYAQTNVLPLDLETKKIKA